MKKLVLGIATVVVVAVTAVAGAFASGGSTVLYEGFSCGILDGNGSVFSTSNSSLTLYSTGKLVLQCEGNGAPAASLTHFNYGNTGLSCGMIVTSTTQWDDKVGRNGNSQLTCIAFVDSVDSASSGGAGIG